jgi:hypothetical protein
MAWICFASPQSLIRELAGRCYPTAYRCARALDAAFGGLTDSLQTVPGIVGLGLGDPGRKVGE